MMMFGGRGFIAGHVKTLYPDALTPSTDIAQREAISTLIEAEKPDVIINAAGKTGSPNVDWCESHRAETLHSNVLGPLVLLEECMKRNVYMVHIGSGCIYQGDNDGRGYSEDDPPNFYGSYYSRSKAWSDQMLKDFPVLQLRIRMPFHSTNEPRNLITKLKGYPRVLDCQNSVTYIPDFLRALETLLNLRATGIYNVVNPSTISPYEIMMLYREIVDPQHTCVRLTLDDLSSVVKAGRSNCILSTDKIHAEGVKMLPVKEAVTAALIGMKEERMKC